MGFTGGVPHAAIEMQTAIQAMPSATVYITAGSGATQSSTPVSTTVVFTSVTVTEVSFSLGSLTYYTLS